MRETTLQGGKKRERGEEVIQAPEQKFSCSLWREHEEQKPTMQATEGSTLGQGIFPEELQHMETPHQDRLRLSDGSS